MEKVALIDLNAKLTIYYYDIAMNFSDDGDDIRQEERDKQQAQLRDDFNNEMAGRDVGRISRFLSADTREARTNGNKREERRAAMTTLQMLLSNDPEYARLYRDTERRLHEAQDRLDAALETVLRTKEQTEERLRNARNEAERQAQQERLDTLNDLENDIRSGQAEIGDMQLRMGDQENHVQSEEMEGFHDRLDEIENAIAPRVEAITASRSTVLPDSNADAVFSKATPDIPKF